MHLPVMNRCLGPPTCLRSLASFSRRKYSTRRFVASQAAASASAAESAEASRGGFRGTDTSPWSTTRRRNVAEMLPQLQQIFQEAVTLSIQMGPRGFIRAAQLMQAVLQVTQEYISSGQVDPPERILRKLFEKLGATYIKLGQFIASSPSLFPDEFVTEFQKCLDKTDPVPFPVIMETIRQELTLPVDQVFSHIEPTPLASASIAQVHTAVLRGSDKEVALKVLKPGVQDVLTADLNFLYLLSKLLEVVNPELERTSLAGIVEDIRNSMLDEVDFRKEAVHVQQFSSYLDKTGMRAFATCPYVYEQYSSSRLLTMEKLDGVPLSDLDSIRSVTSANPETTLINALNTWFGSVLSCDTFHADVHAGNLLVMPNGRVAFLDFGIVGKVSPTTWKAVEALMIATASGDYRTMARALATMKATAGEVDIDAFARDLEVLFEEIKTIDSQVVVTASGAGQPNMAASVTFDDAQVNRLLLQVVRVGETHGIRFPREFGLLVKQVLYFDRYVRLLAPGLEVLNDSRVSIGSLSRGAGPVSFRTQL